MLRNRAFSTFSRTEMIQILSELRAAKIRTAMRCLCDVEFKAVFLRYWGPMTIEEIARHLRISWDDADALIERSHVKLRNAYSVDAPSCSRVIRGRFFRRTRRLERTTPAGRSV